MEYSLFVLVVNLVGFSAPKTNDIFHTRLKIYN